MLVWTQQYRWLNLAKRITFIILWCLRVAQTSQFLFFPLFDCVSLLVEPLTDTKWLWFSDRWSDTYEAAKMSLALLPCVLCSTTSWKKKKITTVLFPADCLHGAFVSSATCRDSAGSLELILWCAPLLLILPSFRPTLHSHARRHPCKCTQNDKKKVSRARCQQTAATALVYAGDEWDRSLLNLPK